MSVNYAKELLFLKPQNVFESVLSFGKLSNPLRSRNFIIRMSWGSFSTLWKRSIVFYTPRKRNFGGI